MTEEEAKSILASAQRICLEIDNISSVTRQIVDNNDASQMTGCVLSILESITFGVMVPIVAKFPELDPDNADFH